MMKYLLSLFLLISAKLAEAYQPPMFWGILGSSGCFEQTCKNVNTWIPYTEATCNLNKKAHSNFQYLNNYYTFMGVSSAPISVSNTACSPFTDYNTTFTEFNNKTNKNIAITTLVGNPTAGQINQNFANLRSNIKTKLESTMALTHSVLNIWESPFISNSIAGANLFMKIENSAYSKIDIAPQNGTTCVNNEYCKKGFSSEVSTPYQLGVLTLNGITNKNLLLTKEPIDEYAPHRPGDWGCYDADVASDMGRNIWSCQGGSYNCSTFCYAWNCRSNMSWGRPNWASYNADPVRALFNQFINTHGLYTYLGWEYTTGDIRGGCGGAYVYGIRIKYRVNRYRMIVQ